MTDPCGPTCIQDAPPQREQLLLYLLTIEIEKIARNDHVLAWLIAGLVKKRELAVMKR